MIIQRIGAQLTMVLFVQSITSVAFAGDLAKDIEDSSSVMWSGAHSDDELLVGGTLSYLARKKGYTCTIVGFGGNGLDEGNRQSAKFLNDADYFRILEIMRDGGEIVAGNRKNIGKRTKYKVRLEPVKMKSGMDLSAGIAREVDKWSKDGTKDILVKIIKKKRPDIVFTFEPTNGFRSFTSHAASSIITRMAIEESGVPCKLYYVINRNPVFRGMLGGDLDPLPVTDVMELDEEAWNGKMKMLGFYSYSYRFLEDIINDPNIQKRMVRKEFFRKVDLQPQPRPKPEAAKK